MDMSWHGPQSWTFTFGASQAADLCLLFLLAIACKPRGSKGGHGTPIDRSCSLILVSAAYLIANGQLVDGPPHALRAERTMPRTTPSSCSHLPFVAGSSPAVVDWKRPLDKIHRRNCCDTNSLARSVCTLATGTWRACNLAIIKATTSKTSLGLRDRIGIDWVRFDTSTRDLVFRSSFHCWSRTSNSWTSASVRSGCFASATSRKGSSGGFKFSPSCWTWSPCWSHGGDRSAPTCFRWLSLSWFCPLPRPLVTIPRISLGCAEDEEHGKGSWSDFWASPSTALSASFLKPSTKGVFSTHRDCDVSGEIVPWFLDRLINSNFIGSRNVKGQAKGINCVLTSMPSISSSVLYTYSTVPSIRAVSPGHMIFPLAHFMKFSRNYLTQPWRPVIVELHQAFSQNLLQTRCPWCQTLRKLNSISDILRPLRLTPWFAFVATQTLKTNHIRKICQKCGRLHRLVA